MLRLALTKLVEIVGEAAKQVSETTRRAHPSIPWSAATRMRDRLVHHHFDIDLDVLWATITTEPPVLLRSLPPAGRPPGLSLSTTAGGPSPGRANALPTISAARVSAPGMRWL